jgi:hypothetical protein
MDSHSVIEVHNTSSEEDQMIIDVSEADEPQVDNAGSELQDQSSARGSPCPLQSASQRASSAKHDLVLDLSAQADLTLILSIHCLRKKSPMTAKSQ